MSDVTDTYYEGEAIHGYGTQLLVGDGSSPEEFTAVADVISITPGTMETAVIEKTHLRSPEAHREKLLGMRDSGPFVVELNWRPRHESQNNAGGGSGAFASGGLIAIWRERQEKNYIIQIIDGVSPPLEWPFAGGVTKFQPGGINVDDKIGATVEITPLRDFSAELP